MKLLSAINIIFPDIFLFCVLGFLALGFGQDVFSPSPGQAAGMGATMSAIFLYPFAVAGVIIGLVKYRLWRNGLFWMLLVISVLAVFAGSQNGITVRRGDVGSALFVATLFPPVLTVPLWQLIMAVSWGARTLKG